MPADALLQSTPTIVILDDDKLSTHNLALQFRFMGEHPRCVGSDNWRSLLQNLKAGDEYQQLLAVVVGQVHRTGRQELLELLHDYDARLPLLVIQHQADSAAEQGELEAALPDAGNASGQIHWLHGRTLNYESLQKTLEDAAAFSGRQRQVPASAIISAGGAALFRSLSGGNPVIEQLRELIPQVARRDVTVMVLGESGAGKEVVARNLHYHSGRAGKPFVAVNCAAMVPASMGAELFGCEDQLNGQTRVQPGLLEQAEGGTIFFDQISELPLNLQAVLLRFLEDRQFQRIGGYQFVSTNVRVVVGCRHNLEELIAQDKFRKDLYYRLNTMPLHVPPLRERLDDIPELIRELIASLESKGYPAIRLNSSAVQSLQRHDWPGNVRELANLIERLGIIQPEIVTGIQDLPVQYQHPEPESIEEPDNSDTQALDRNVARIGAPRQDTTVEETRIATGLNAASNATDGSANGRFPGPGALILPLEAARVEHYLASFERQILQTALDDCAGILSFTAERLGLEEGILDTRLQTHALKS